MNLYELLSVYNINLNESQDIFDVFDLQDNSYVIDIFPQKIQNVFKYESVEFFYQKVLDKKIELSKFENIEDRFINLIRTFWLYNDVYVDIFSNSDKINKNYYFKHNRRIFYKHSKQLQKISKNKDQVFLVDDGKFLEILCRIATRDIATVMFIFNNFKSMILLNDCVARIHFFDNSEFNVVNDIIRNNQLYIYSP